LFKEKGLFITATDTDVGKTFVTGLLAKALLNKEISTGIFKPIATGCTKDKNNNLVSEDAVFLKKITGLDYNLDEITPIKFKPPLAPLAATMETGIDINLNSIFEHLKQLEQKYDKVLIEGIGGLMVPIKHKYLVLDLIEQINYPVIIVARPNLGTINHTLLTCEVLKQRNINIKGIIINNSAKSEIASSLEAPRNDTASVITDKAKQLIKNHTDISIKTNKQIIEQESGIKILGEIPYIENIEKINISSIINNIGLCK
jgi:dethiobiotin synthetase